MAYRYQARAFNPFTREWMDKPTRPSMFDYEHISEWLPVYYQYISDMKKWDAFIAELPKTLTWKRPKLVHAMEKGVPVKGVHKRKRRKYVNGAGVSANSRILSHHYRDEGECGQGHRREIKRKERALWLSEWQDEQRDQEDAYSVSEWYTSVYGVEDWEANESIWTRSEREHGQGPCEL